MKNIIKSRENLFSLLYSFFGSKSFQKKKKKVLYAPWLRFFFDKRWYLSLIMIFQSRYLFQFKQKNTRQNFGEKSKSESKRQKILFIPPDRKRKKKPIFSWKVETKMKGFWRTFIFFLFGGGGEGEGKKKGSTVTVLKNLPIHFTNYGGTKKNN